MCTFTFLVNVCPCYYGHDCLVSGRARLVVVNGYLHHVLGEPVPQSKLCARRRRMGKDAVPSRACLRTPLASRQNSSGDRTTFLIAKDLCDDCRLCEQASGWI